MAPSVGTRLALATVLCLVRELRAVKATMWVGRCPKLPARAPRHVLRKQAPQRASLCQQQQEFVEERALVAVAENQSFVDPGA